MRSTSTHDKTLNKNISEEQAEALLNDILKDLRLGSAKSRAGKKWHFRRIALFRYLTKRAALLVCVSLAFFFFAPGTVVPASVSNVSAAPASEVNVEENGYLLLDVYSATGMHSSHGIEIDGIDEDAPVVVNYQADGDLILIYLSDGDGVGVDFDTITACCTDTDEALAPTWCDESSGCVAFPCMDQPVEITVADRNGNYRVLLLAPSWN